MLPSLISGVVWCIASDSSSRAGDPDSSLTDGAMLSRAGQPSRELQVSVSTQGWTSQANPAVAATTA